MTKIKSYIHGIYPRSHDLIQVSRAMIRKLKSEAEYLRQFKKDTDSLYDLQKSLDLDFIEDGKLAWHDSFRPVVEAVKGFEVGALTRWFDNNCFFRQPVLTGKLTLDESKLDKAFTKITPAKKWKVTLPSPFTFAKLIRNESNLTFDKSLNEITSILSQIVKYLDQKGVSFIQFNEPFLAYDKPSPADIKLFQNALTQLGKVKNKLTFSVQFYFGDASYVINSLKKADSIDIIGVDFYKTALSSLPKDFPYDLSAGILDGRNSLKEKEDSLKRFINDAVKTVSPEILYITNNSDLELLPETIAREKVELLAKVRDSFN